jgi:hypothetical protein
VTLFSEDATPGSARRVTTVRVSIDGRCTPDFIVGTQAGDRLLGAKVWVEVFGSDGGEIAEFSMPDSVVCGSFGAVIDYNARAEGEAPIVLFDSVESVQVELREGSGNVRRRSLPR